jgi:ribosome biogenesis GTPase A
LLAPYVNTMDREQLLKGLFSKIYNRSIVVYVCDIANFEGSLDARILEEIEKGKHRMLFVVNKIDALPKGWKVERVQLWVKNQLK